MTLLGFDVNACRARAVHGRPGDVPASAELEPPRPELPLALRADGRRVEIGTPALAMCQERPDTVYRNFLPKIAKTLSGPRRWQPVTHSFDPAQALRIVLEKLRGHCRRGSDVAVSLPPYLDNEQLQYFNREAVSAKLPVRASVVGPLAAGLAAYSENPWTGSVLLIDLDDHALWLSLLQETRGQIRLLRTYLYPKLSLIRWQHRLLNALADCCILQSRRDPRVFPAAEQALFMQLTGVMESCVRNQTADVSFQTSNWYQNLSLQPAEVESFCVCLVRPIIADVHMLYDTIWPEKAPSAVLLTAEAARLPGLAVALEECLDRWCNVSEMDDVSDDSDDFGAHLMEDDDADDDSEEHVAQIIVLSPDAAAHGAHRVAGYVLSGVTSEGHLGETAPLPEPQAADAGVARLQFQGRDYPLGDRNLILGYRHDCDLVFDRLRWSTVSPRHCEVVYDPRQCYLKDLSKKGVWINDRPVTQPTPLEPGDRIRLGPNGPVVRFLGRPGTQGLMTIA